MQNSEFWTRNSSLYRSQTSSVVLSAHKCVISIRITSLYGSKPLSVVFAIKTATFGSELQNSVSQTSPVVLCMQNSVIRITMTSLYGSQTSPVVLYIQNSVICTRITSLSVSQSSSVVSACKTAHFGPESQVSMGPRPQLWF